MPLRLLNSIASSAGPLNPSLEQQLEATIEILLQAAVALNEAIVERPSAAVHVIRSVSAAACCLVLEEQKDNFTVHIAVELLEKFTRKRVNYA